MAKPSGRGLDGHTIAEILDSIEGAVFIEDLKGNVVYANKKVEDLYGYTVDELLGGGLEKIIPEEERQKVGGVVAELLKHGKTRFLAYNVTKKREKIPVEIYANLLEDNKKYAVITVHDLRTRKSEEAILQMIGEYSGEAIVVTREDGDVVWWNRAAEKLFGYSKGEILGKKFYDYIMADGEKYKHLILRAKNMENIAFEGRIVEDMKKKSGEVFKAEISHSVFKIGEEKYALTVVRDITSRLNFEKLLMEEREKYRNLLESMLNIVIIIQDEKIVYVNRAFEELSGYQRDEIIGKHFTILLDEGVKPLVIERYRKRMYGEPAPEEYVIPVRVKGNELMWVYIRGKKVDYDGKPADLISMVDITTLKERETKLLAITEMIKKLKSVKTKEEMFDIVVNTLHKDLKFEHVGIAEVRGDVISSVVYVGNYKGMVEIPLNGDKGVSVMAVKENRPYYIPDTKKEERYIEGVEGARCEYVTPISTSEKIYGVIDVEREKVDSISPYDRFLVDIVASHLALSIEGWEDEKKLRESKELQELMLHIVSHDLKTPLAVINGYAELIKEEMKQEYVDEIKDAVEKAIEIMDKARLLSKLDLGMIDAQVDEIELKKVILEMVALIKKRYPGVRVQVRGRNVEVIGYSILLKELFQNLLDNAFKYGATNVVVRISKKGDSVVARVEDDGYGISEENRERIFEPFVRYGAGGTGLGLSIVMRIVKLHDGKIWVEANEPRGSVFVIELPTAK